MAFETLTPLISYPADGVTTTFGIPDKFYDASDVKLFFVDATGIEGQYDFGTDYSVVITATDPTPPARKSGNVVLVTPPATGLSVVVFIWPDSDQDQPFEGQPVTPRQNERVHDRHAMRDASLRELLFRGFRAPLNAAPALRYIEVGAAGRVPVYAPDGSGSLVEGPTVGEVSLVSGIVPEIIVVAGIAGSIVTVATNNARVTIVANAINNVNLVGDNIASVATVAGSIASVNTVSANIVAVNNVHVNMASVVDAVNQATAAAASALLASRFATYPANTDIPGQGGLRSALHWAAQAAASAATAAANIAGAIIGYTTQAVPLDADFGVFVRASDSLGRKLTMANLKTFFAGAFSRHDIAQTLTQAQIGQHAVNTGQAWEQIGLPINPAGLTTVSWTGLSAFRSLRIKGGVIEPSGVVDVIIQLGVGGSYFTGATEYQWMYWYNNDSAINAPTGGHAGSGSIVPYPNAVGPAGITFDLDINELNKVKRTQFAVRSLSANGNVGVNYFAEYNGRMYDNVVAMDCLRISVNSGTMTTGYLVLEGRRG